MLTLLNQGQLINEVELGEISWSNELVTHVIELKLTRPIVDLSKVDTLFHQAIVAMNETLASYNSMLLPTAMHPWFDPETETRVWPHGQSEIYSLYNKIFNCKGHGWSNLQSVHINLPYQNEKEFVTLHTAIRAVLPIVPLLSASSPFHDGVVGDVADNRLSFYEKNQIKVPSIAGNIIPEKIRSYTDYKNVFKKIFKDISPYDPERVLQKPWLNSRGAIPKFDVGAIEIRLMDIQESSYMDICLVSLIVELVKYIAESEERLEKAMELSDSVLRAAYNSAKEFESDFCDKQYFSLFISEEIQDIGHLRAAIIETFMERVDPHYHKGLKWILRRGTLAKRLLDRGLGIETYQQLAKCLEKNSMF